VNNGFPPAGEGPLPATTDGRPVLPPRVNAEPEAKPLLVEAHEEEAPTLSHELANEDHDEKGAAQIEHGSTEVRDLGWNDPSPPVLVGGLPNEELWTLVRRFNKVCFSGISTESNKHSSTNLE